MKEMNLRRMLDTQTSTLQYQAEEQSTKQERGCSAGSKKLEERREE
jgi:hypothetical protein